MSSPDYAITPISFAALPANVSFVSGTTIRALVDGSQFAQNLVPATNAPVAYGGCTLIDLNATSTDTVARDVQLYEGRILTTQSAGATGTLSTAASSITRVNGSWITDGWRVGHGVILVPPEGVAEDAQSGIFALVSAVSATVLTLATAALSVNAGLAAGTRVVRARPLGRVTVAIGQGTGTTNPLPLDILGTLSNGLTVKTERKLGTTDMLLAGLVAAPTANTKVSLGGLVAGY
jgi:hypothetical protein